MERKIQDHKTEQPIIVQIPATKPLYVVVVIILLVQSFFLGSLWTKVEILQKGGITTAKAPAPSAGGQAAAVPQAPPQTASDVPKVSKDDHIRGDKNARLALIEYSDIECPFCKRFHPTAQQVVDTYKGKVMWVYRHYPLSFHANAQKEAEAVECANEQGGNDAFWKYLDSIYERTTSNGTGFALDKLVPLAKELGLDETKFKLCLDGGKFADHVKQDMDGGTKAGVTGTPGNIILDTKTGATRLIPGAVPFEQVKAVIDEMLKS